MNHKWEHIAAPMPFFAALSIADNAAQILALQRQSADKFDTDEMERMFPGSRALSRKTRMILRENAVNALRYLWATGDPSQRSTVACRVWVWLKKGADGIGERVLEREKARMK